MSTTAEIRELAEKIWLNATSHGHGEPIAAQAKAIIALLADMEGQQEPVAYNGQALTPRLVATMQG